MDIFDEDLLNYWRCLNRHAVKYIMVGGVATNLNGYHRTTDDIDIWIEDTLENRERFLDAYNEYSGTSINKEKFFKMQIIHGWTDFHLNSGYRLNLHPEMKGLEHLSFDDCLAISPRASIDDVSIPFLHINHLITNKKAVNRPKDQLDVIYLEKIKKIQDENL